MTFTEEQKDVIKELREDNKGYHSIANVLGVRGSQIKRWCQLNNLGGLRCTGKRNDNTFFEKDGYTVGVDTKGREFYFDTEDLYKVKEYYWFVPLDGYVHTTTKRKDILLHRYLIDVEAGKETDHINRIKHDCRKSNLRTCLHKENMCNVKPQSNNKSGYKGVGHNHTKWRARIKLEGETIDLGRYETAEEAHEAYKKAAELYHGEYGYAM